MAIIKEATGAGYPPPAELLQKLIRFDTTNPPGDERAIVEYLDGLLTGAGFETTILARDEARPNLVTRLPGRGQAPPLLFYGHLDVVSTENQDWTYPPFEGRIVDGFVWGRGALDMKGEVAMMLSALMRARAEGLAPAGDAILALVADEEVGGVYGARYLVEEHPGLFDGVRYAIGEAGGFTLHLSGRRFYPVMVAEKQSCCVRATVRGRAGHGAVPLREALPVGDFMPLAETSATVELPMERPLYRPPLRPRIDETVADEGDADVDTAALYAQVVVDRAALHGHIRQELQAHSQISLAEVVARHPLRHGLVELVAYLHLAAAWPHTAVDDDIEEQVQWQTDAGVVRRATLPRILLLRNP